MSLQNYLSITEAADEFGVTRQRMHQLVDHYNVETIFIGNQKVVSRDALQAIPENRPGAKPRKTQGKERSSKKQK